MTNGHWKYHSEINPVEYEGFIYKITEINTGKEYIGKKNFWAKRKNTYIESNWKSYTSSSKDLNAQIKLHGKDNYKFEIISLHYNKSYLNYREIEELVFNDVLRVTLPNGEKKFYNKAIGNIKFVHQDIISDSTRKKISLHMKGNKIAVGNTNRRGKKCSNETRAKISAAKKGKPGKPHNEEHRAKISASMKGIPKPQQIITCPHCNKSGGEPLMKRYHFDNCKLRII
jgi:hypothetical protein